jgi:hypothetical protein
MFGRGKRNSSQQEAAKNAALEIGDKMNDGTIYAGISPTTHQRMYAEPARWTPSTHAKDFYEAATYAKALQVGDKHDFRVPDKEELNVLFQNRAKGALKDTFNSDGTEIDGYYWSSTLGKIRGAWCQRFTTGEQECCPTDVLTSVRCVR